jgi:hypothetical protein
MHDLVHSAFLPCRVALWTPALSDWCPRPASTAEQMLPRMGSERTEIACERSLDLSDAMKALEVSAILHYLPRGFRRTAGTG